MYPVQEGPRHLRRSFETAYPPGLGTAPPLVLISPAAQDDAQGTPWSGLRAC